MLLLLLALGAVVGIIIAVAVTRLQHHGSNSSGIAAAAAVSRTLSSRCETLSVRIKSFVPLAACRLPCKTLSSSCIQAAVLQDFMHCVKDVQHNVAVSSKSTLSF